MIQLKLMFPTLLGQFLISLEILQGLTNLMKFFLCFVKLKRLFVITALRLKVKTDLKNASVNRSAAFQPKKPLFSFVAASGNKNAPDDVEFPSVASLNNKRKRVTNAATTPERIRSDAKKSDDNSILRQRKLTSGTNLDTNHGLGLVNH